MDTTNTGRILRFLAAHSIDAIADSDGSVLALEQTWRIQTDRTLGDYSEAWVKVRTMSDARDLAGY